MKNGTVIPKLVLYESSDEQETARAPSPLYEVEVINETADDLAMEIKEEEGQDEQEVCRVREDRLPCGGVEVP